MDGVIIEYTGRTETARCSTHRGPRPGAVPGDAGCSGLPQALTQMQQGGRYKIVIPGRLAYGKNPPQGSPIGPNEDLSFDVYVLQVVPNAALSAGVPPG